MIVINNDVSTEELKSTIYPTEQAALQAAEELTVRANAPWRQRDFDAQPSYAVYSFSRQGWIVRPIGPRN